MVFGLCSVRFPVVLVFLRLTLVCSSTGYEKDFSSDFDEREGKRVHATTTDTTANAAPSLMCLARISRLHLPVSHMKGFHVYRKAGWDTHGLPVELQVEQELGLNSKRDIESYGIEAFNQKCRESVFRYVSEWEEMTRRIALWVDMEDPYITLNNDYIESCFWIIKTCGQGLIYQGLRGTPHCHLA